MAILTGIGGIGMTAGFTGSNTAIMATEAGTQHLVMIQRRNNGRPTAGWHTVTRFADVSGIGMVTRFSGRNTAIVATDTGSQYFTVIQRCNKR